jgi:pilus assembly protein FimV
VLKTDKQKRFKASILALAIAAMPLGASAAGLGRLTVLSALGQPLRAEIELTTSRDESASISARLASQDAFKNAGIEYAPSLSAIRFTLDKRPNGQPILQVSSDRALNDPFVDMLVELNWASGRLVREYTFLLDPPDVFKKPAAPAPVALPEVKQETAAPVPALVPTASTPSAAPVAPEAKTPAPVPAAEEKPAKKPVEEKKPVAAKVAEKSPAAPKAADGAATRQVKSGDTLAKIANEVKPEGIDLDQMLVALFRNNSEAFDAGNMNRLRAGKILRIPDKESLASVDRGEARKIVVAQSADFNAYRKKLASATAAEPVKTEAPKQLASGKITPKVEEKAPAPATKDKLEVSRAETGKAGKQAANARASAAEEDLIAREKALKEANSRIAELEKNLTDLKKLAEMKSAAGAKMQEQAAKPAPAVSAKAENLPPAQKPAETPKLAEAPKPVEPPKPAEAAKPVAPPPVAGKPAQEPKPAVAPTASPENAPPAPKPAPKKPAALPAPPPPPPSFVEDNPLVVFGGGGVVALLLGYLGFGAWRKKRQASEEAPSSISGSEISDSSVFATASGQSVDTGASVPTDFSQDAMSGMTDEGVDPVAEADVYMAYGRDSQAEEILLEALKTEPARRAIHLKLLEIYAARKSAAQFEAVARDLQGLTGGVGAEWEKAAALGHSLDPANALYGAGEANTAAAPDFAASTVVTQAEPPAGTGTMAMPGALAQMAAEAEAAASVAVTPEAPVAAVADEVPDSLDFDLGAPAPEVAAAAPEEAPAAPAAADEVMSLDFDLDLGSPASVPAAEATPAVEPASGGLDFDLGTPATAPEATASDVVASAAVEPPAQDGGNEVAALDFDFSLDAPAPEAAPAAVEADLPLDLSAISLELGEPAPAAAEPEAAAPLDMPLEIPAETPSAGVPVETPLDGDLELPAAEVSLDLPVVEPLAADLPAEPAIESPVAMPAEAGAVADDPEVATKLELAQAYEEMGDKEGARELLNEVLNEGSPAQQAAARSKLDLLG